jgi:hypothetical protein
MFVGTDVLEQLTGKKRPSAQARFLLARFPKIIFLFRGDGTIALRQEELDRYTLSGSVAPTKLKKEWRLDLSQFDKAS